METFVEPLFMGMMWLAARGILLSDWWANDLYDKHIDPAIHAFQGGRFNKKQKSFSFFGNGGDGFASGWVSCCCARTCGSVGELGLRNRSFG